MDKCTEIPLQKGPAYSLENMPNSYPVNEVLDTALRDEQAVAAVLGGDMVCYRELVEHYERLVYAVAWSRLGDAAMAEDAAQEAFIRAYRSLPLLGNGAKFAAWVTAIARNTAHSLGLKHRRELEKRARWAVEQPEFEPPAASIDERCPPELLRQTLAELSEMDRESLVLYYLEGKKGGEAATALGISESALRMRLMRARAALRERLEARLGESLTRLQPSHSMVPGVMGIIASTSTTKAGGAALGTTLLAGLGKVLPFGLAVVFANMASAISASGIFWWIAKLERRNYREPEGFRAQIQRDLSRHGLMWFWVQAGGVISLFFIISILVGEKIGFGLFGVGFLPPLLYSMRYIQIDRRKHSLSMLVFALMACSGPIAVGLGLLPESWILLVCLVMLIPVIPITCTVDSPRMDGSLFLRERMGLLKTTGEMAPSSPAEGNLSRAKLLAFARFLGVRNLLSDYQWTQSRDSLLLRLHPAKAMIETKTALSALYFPRWQWRHCSWIRLATDGSVAAQCGRYDEPYLRQLAGADQVDIAETERRVAVALQSAWISFREGSFSLAANQIGEVPETEIFRVPHERSIMTRVMKVTVIAALAGLVVLSGFLFRADLYEQHMEAGIAKFNQHDYRRAIADFDQFIAFNPRFANTNIANAYNYRGVAKDYQGDAAAALADYSKAIELNPKNALAYYNRGESYQKMGDGRSALTDFNRYIILVPKDPDGYRHRGDVRKALSDSTGAQADYDYAQEIDPNIPAACKNRVVVKPASGNAAGTPSQS